jgi:hypothetical protein
MKDADSIKHDEGALPDHELLEQPGNATVPFEAMAEPLASVPGVCRCSGTPRELPRRQWPERLAPTLF